MRPWEIKILFAAGLLLLSAIYSSFDAYRYALTAEWTEATFTRVEEVEVPQPDGATRVMLDSDLEWTDTNGSIISLNKIRPLHTGYATGDTVEVRYFQGNPESVWLWGSMTLVWPTLLLGTIAICSGGAFLIAREMKQPFGVH